jgi:NodT family efflux transporter outer membrane factor (OMF) lipoprotein
MWIVKIALSRPYTFIVLGLLILILSPVAILRTPTDIFPNINIPVVAVSWAYAGLNPAEMEGRFTLVYERLLTTTVDNIEHVESTTINGIAIVKIYFQPRASLNKANAQVTAISQTILRQLPSGSLPPVILNYSASTVPILQLALSGKDLSEAQLNDLAINFLRPGLVTIPGASIPKNEEPQYFKAELPSNVGPGENWTIAIPNETVPRGQWWKLFGDHRLDALENQLSVSNNNLVVADARLREARAALRFSRASLYPTLGLSPNVGDVRSSANQPYFNKALANDGTGVYTFPIELSYEVDLWGRVRRSVNSVEDQMQAEKGDLEVARLSLAAELARDYFDLRSVDLQLALLRQTITAYEKALHLTELRYEGGASPRAEMEQAKTQLASAKVQETDTLILRQTTENAIAVLIGENPSVFKIESYYGYHIVLPRIPVVLPANLLEGRPDVAAAERRMAATNEQLGIAKAACYPAITLSAQAGFESVTPSTWFIWPSRFWALGATVSEVIFDGGRRKAASEAARANYDAVVAVYRQTTLTAFEEVEDNLIELSVLEKEAGEQKAATDSAEETLKLFTKRYNDDVDTYLQVVTSQTAALENERNQIEISRRQMDDCVLLVKAVGGGWNTNELGN